MLKELDLNDWISGLDGNSAKIITDAATREDWSADDVEEVREAIDALSHKMKELNVSGELNSAISTVAPEVLLGCMSTFSFPRAVRLFSIIGNANPEYSTEVLKAGVSHDKDLKKQQSIMILRILYMSRTSLINRIFEADRLSAICSSLSNYTRSVKEKRKKSSQQTSDTAE